MKSQFSDDPSATTQDEAQPHGFRTTSPHANQLGRPRSAGVEDDHDFDDTDSDDDLDDARADDEAAARRRSSGPDLDHLSVTLVAELGTLTLTLGALKSIEPGMLLELASRNNGEVMLRAIDGPVLAHAELVDIGGNVGLQITRVIPS